MRFATLTILAALTLLQLATAQTDRPQRETPAERGRRLLLERPYVPATFDEEIVADIWRSWDQASRAEAEKKTPAERRRMIFDRYGLSPRPENPELPLQYTVVDGNWSMNCFACHGGRIGTEPFEGLGNGHFALQSLVDDVVTTKRRLGRKLELREMVPFPQGSTIGTTNCVAFGVVLGSMRRSDLTVRPFPKSYGKVVHHDMDAPAWWLYSRKTRLYVDGHAPKGHRELMQFVLAPSNGPEKFHAWEDEFRDIEAYIESIEPPAYPAAIDSELAAAGRKVFDRTCARCHGTYDDDGRLEAYPAKMVPMSIIHTDPLRHRALRTPLLTALRESWFAEGRREAFDVDPVGYVAPPLSGVWATAPYLHNGSIPTLGGVLDSTKRPARWRRDPDTYLTGADVGIAAERLEAAPEGLSRHEQRRVFDTAVPGKSNRGHRFGDVLEDGERRAVVEYLKNL